jgi:hypothetical protein
LPELLQFGGCQHAAATGAHAGAAVAEVDFFGADVNAEAAAVAVGDAAAAAVASSVVDESGVGAAAFAFAIANLVFEAEGINLVYQVSG